MAAIRASWIVCWGILGLSTAWASDYSLQDFGINTNGTVTDPTLSVGASNPYSLAGVATSGSWTTTGLGSATYTYNPGKAGTYFVDFFVDPQAGTPYYNEYGLVGGAPGTGVSYQIDESQLGSVFGNFTANSFDDKNDLPGGTSNYSNACAYVSGGACNGDTAFGVGFAFSLTASQEALFTLTGTTANPGGFYLEDVHPVDQNTAAAADYFLTAGEVIQPATTPPPPQSPEPASELLVGGGFIAIALFAPALRRRVSR